MSNGDRFYPKQSLRSAVERSKPGLGPPSLRERVRTGDWPAQSERASLSSGQRMAQREANTREIDRRAGGGDTPPEWRYKTPRLSRANLRERRWRRMTRAMSAKR